MNILKRNILAILFVAAFVLSAAMFGISLGNTAEASTNITVTNVLYATKDNDTYVFHIKLSSKPAKSEYDYYSDQSGDSSVPDQIILNGKSVRTWNAEYRTTAAEWTFNRFPANSEGYYYKMPIILRSSGGNTAIEVYIHENMYPIIKGEEDAVKLEVQSGLVVKDDMVIADDCAYNIAGDNGSFAITAALKTVEIAAENVSVSGWIHQNNELEVFYVNLGEGVMPELGYKIIDNASYTYLADYIAINGKTIAEINSTTDTSGYTFSVFPSTAGGVYAVPVMVLVDGSYNIQVKLHDTYYATLDGLTVTIKNGFSIVNGNKEYVLNEDVTYERKDGVWGVPAAVVDVTANVTIGNFRVESELKKFDIGFPAGALPNLSYSVMDNNDYKYIAEYIAINGATVKDINLGVDTTGWEFTVFPSSAADIYKVPVIIYISGNKIEVRVHENYYNTLNGFTVTVLDGLTVLNDNTEYVVTSSVASSYNAKYDAWGDNWQTVDVTDGIVVENFIHQADELRVFYITLGNTVMPAEIGYGIISDENYKYIADYITINGKTITEINAETDTEGWTFSVFPSSADSKYAIPVIVYVSGNKLEIKIHDNYYNTLDGLTIAVKDGLSILNGETEYNVTADTAYEYKHGVWGSNWQTVDVTDGVVIENFIHQADELRVFYITLGETVMPEIGYGIISDDNYKYIADYITINGKTITEINAETDTEGWTFSVFPSSAADAYKIPVIVYVSGNRLEIKIHDNYYDTLDGLTVAVKDGLMILNGETEYVVSEETAYEYRHGVWGSNWQTVDVTDGVVIENFIHQADELRVFYITLGETVMPEIGYGILSDENYKYIADYITINGNTITEINATTDTTGWTFSVFPSSAADAYKIPVIVYVSGNRLEIKIHDNYYDTLDGLNVSVTKGLMILNGENEYTVSDFVAYDYKYGVWGTNWQTVDISEDITIGEWVQQNGLKYFKIYLPDGALPKIDFSIINKDEYKYIADYITINGKTITEINATTDTTDWTFEAFPSSTMDAFKVAIVLYVNSESNYIEVRIHDNYYAAIEGDLTVKVTDGLVIVNGETEYEVGEEVTYARKHGSWGRDWQTVDVTENTVVSKWISQEELKVFFINFGEGVLPAGINYGVIDKADYKYIADYITINGKTITEINATTDTTGWTFSVFPSTADDRYKLPVVVYVSSEKIEVKIHDLYRASLSGKLTVSILEGLVIVNGETEYTVSEEKSYILRSDTWLNLGEEFTVTYYVNGDVYAVETYTLADTIEMRAYPKADVGYEFSGWDKTINKISSGNEEIYGYLTTIKYSITYNLSVDGAENSPFNPIRYTVESDTIVLSDPIAEGYVFKGWFDEDGNEVTSIEKGSHGDLVLKAKFYQTNNKSCSSGISGGFIGGIAFIASGALILLRKKKENR